MSRKQRFKRVTLVAGLALVWHLTEAAPGTVTGADVDSCNTTAVLPDGSWCWLVDPPGCGKMLLEVGVAIFVYVKDAAGQPVPSIPASDIWLFGCNDNIVLCTGPSSSQADHETDGGGATTFTGTIRGGGCDVGVSVAVQGTAIADPDDCTRPQCLAIRVMSPDIDQDLTVDTPDFTLFANGYSSPPKAYDMCLDYNCDGMVELADFTLFAQHYLITCASAC